MKSMRLAMCVLAVLTHSASISAYEIDTHEKLSIDAYVASNLQQDPNVQGNLGLNASDKFPGSDGIQKSIIQLIGDGAKFEDSLSFDRPMNHFYNPLTGAPLTILGFAPGSPSPDWALEDKGQINGVLGKQEFSYQDARQYFYDALTQADKTKREQNFGKTFQTMGHIIHHVQDMAQPQHVRNDQHLELSAGKATALCLFPPACIAYLAIKNPSVYEAYTNRSDVRVKLPIDFSLAGYDINDSKFASTFNAPRNLWHTADGKGMADFTNRGFVSAGTIFDIAFPSPVLDLSKKLDFDIKDLVPGTSLKGNVRFYGNTVTDNYTGVSVNNPMAVTRSIFDAELEKYATFGKKAVYTLNRFNFDVAHSFLIPRAVGYSAGLINYFFRGKIDFIEDTNNAGKYVIKNLGPEDMKGAFTLYYDAVDGKRYPVAGDTPSTTWAARAISSKGQLDNLTLTPPTSPAPSIPGEFMLVFNGDMGEEKAVPGITVGAVAAKKVETIGFYVVPIDGQQLIGFSGYGEYLYTRGIGKVSGSHYVNGLMVYGRDTYHVENPNSSKQAAYAIKNGVPFFSEVASFNDIAGNSKEIFVVAVHDVGDPVVTVYDFAGSYLRSFTVNPQYYYQGGFVQIVANDTNLISSSNNSMSIYNVSGALLRYIDLGLNVFESILAVSKSRVYRADFRNNNSNVHVYDLDGTPQGVISIPTAGDITCMDATDTNLYVVSSERLGFSTYRGRIHVYSRDAKNDAHLLISVADIPIGTWGYACSVDRAERKPLQ